jgi:hypothetical protein
MILKDCVGEVGSAVEQVGSKIEKMGSEVGKIGREVGKVENEVAALGSLFKRFLDDHEKNKDTEVANDQPAHTSISAELTITPAQLQTLMSLDGKPPKTTRSNYITMSMGQQLTLQCSQNESIGWRFLDQQHLSRNILVHHCRPHHLFRMYRNGCL